VKPKRFVDPCNNFIHLDDLKDMEAPNFVAKHIRDMRLVESNKLVGRHDISGRLVGTNRYLIPQDHAKRV
jgi:hypothetical protein